MIPPKSEATAAATAERRVNSQNLLHLDDDECLKPGGFVIIV